MKRTILAVALVAVTMASGAAHASRYISENAPKIPRNTDAQSAIQRMKNAGWKKHKTECMNVYIQMCDVEFINPCGIIVQATFAGQKLSKMEIVSQIRDSNYPSPPCPPVEDQE